MKYIILRNFSVIILLFLTFFVLGCTDKVSPSNDMIYNGELELWGTDKYLNTEPKEGNFYIGLDLNNIVGVKVIKLHTGGNEYIYNGRYVEKDKEGDVFFIEFSPDDNYFPGNTYLRFRNPGLSGKIIIDQVEWPADTDGDGILDTKIVDNGANGKDLLKKDYF